jgi:hypothetical protein
MMRPALGAPGAAGAAARWRPPCLALPRRPWNSSPAPPKGELKNPYNGNIAAIAEEGHHRYLSAGLQWLPWRRRRGRHVSSADQRGSTAPMTTRFSA